MAIERNINKTRQVNNEFSNGGSASSLINVDTTNTKKNSSYETIPDKVSASDYNAIEPELGAFTYDKDTNTIKYYNGGKWVEIGSSSSNGTEYELNGGLSQIIEHKKERYVDVMLFNENGNVFEAPIQYIDNNSIRITSTIPLTGKAYIN